MRSEMIFIIVSTECCLRRRDGPPIKKLSLQKAPPFCFGRKTFLSGTRALIFYLKVAVCGDTISVSNTGADIMKRFVSILLVLLFVLCFVGCEDSTGDQTPTDNAPKSTIDPSTVNFGYDAESDKYDRWYLQGTDDVVYVYFSDDNAEGIEEFVCRYNLVKSGVVTESAALSLSDDNHLSPPVTSSVFVDIVFEDYFNAYDYATNNRYSRGNADEYNAYFAGKVFEDGDNAENTITFNADGTCINSDSEAEAQGTWEVTSPDTLSCSFDDSTTEYKISYYDDFSIKSIEYDNKIYYAEVSEDETVNKYKAY